MLLDSIKEEGPQMASDLQAYILRGETELEEFIESELGNEKHDRLDG
jgi:hypothetical protein